MIIYGQTALAISALALLTLYLLNTSPARLRFYICIIGLNAWLIPWSSLTLPTPPQILQQPKHAIESIVLPQIEKLEPVLLNHNPFSKNRTAPTKTNLATKPKPAFNSYSKLTYIWVFVFALGIGFLLFAYDLFHYFALQRYWLKNSNPANQLWRIAGFKIQPYEIRTLDNEGPGMTTGFRKPIIWIEKSYTEPQKIRAILLHEMTHIKQYDPVWLWFVNLVQRLFWWNPIVYWLAVQARQLIELSCDESCDQQLANGNYRQDLIEIVLGEQRATNHYALGIHLAKNFNLKRILYLRNQHPLNLKHKAILLCSALLFVCFAWSFATASTLSTSNSRTDVNIAYLENHDMYADIREVITAYAESNQHQVITNLKVKAGVTLYGQHPYTVNYPMLLNILAIQGFDSIKNKDILTILPLAETKSPNEPVVIQRDQRADDPVTAIIQVRNAPVQQIIPILRPLVPREGHLVAFQSSNAIVITDRYKNTKKIERIIKLLDTKYDKIFSRPDIELIATNAPRKPTKI